MYAVVNIVVYALLGIYLAAAKSVPLVPRFQHSMEIFAGQLCVFGGKSTTVGVSLSDFLLDYRCVDVTNRIDQKRPNWKLQSSASRFAMPPIAQHSSVYDRANHIIVPYGGQVPSTFSQANHLAVYCSQFQAWGTSNIVDADPRRYVHTAVLQEKSSDMIIFGGASDETTDNSQNPRWRNVNRMVLDSFRHQSHMQSLGYNDDIHVNSSVGAIITDDGDATPDAIDGVIQHASILMNDTQMVVLGGNTYNAKADKAENLSFKTVYIYDIDKMKWYTRECDGQIPLPRSVFAASRYKNFIYIHAGVNVTDWATFFADLYELDTITWRWRKMPTPNAPIPRYAHQMETLGHYLIITHGYVSNGTGYSGDENIYFYDLTKEAFVDEYSPKGISNNELDIQWLAKTTQSTKGILAVCYILTLFVFFAALYYFVKEITEKIKKQRPVAQRNAASSGIRSKVVSYAGSWRGSAYLFDTKRSKTLGEERRASHDTDGVTLVYSAAGAGRRQSATRTRKSDSGGRIRSHSVSEGTSTVIDSEMTPLEMRSNNGVLPENMRHTRVLDDAPANEPYVARRLTLSQRVPGYRARRPSEGPTVRFSDYIPENNPIDDEEYDDVMEQQYLDIDQSSLSSISIDRQFELSAIAEHSDEQSSIGGGNDEDAADRN
ncbi:Leucine-zipper-like transcriptional regulator 1, partial [Coemansia sp. RSA 1721]